MSTWSSNSRISVFQNIVTITVSTHVRCLRQPSLDIIVSVLSVCWQRELTRSKLRVVSPVRVIEIGCVCVVVCVVVSGSTVSTTTARSWPQACSSISVWAPAMKKVLPPDGPRSSCWTRLLHFTWQPTSGWLRALRSKPRSYGPEEKGALNTRMFYDDRRLYCLL